LEKTNNRKLKQERKLSTRPFEQKTTPPFRDTTSQKQTSKKKKLDHNGGTPKKNNTKGKKGKGRSEGALRTVKVGGAGKGDEH